MQISSVLWKMAEISFSAPQNTMLVYQVTLKSDNSILTAWMDKKLRVGNKVTLKDEPLRWWTVAAVFNSMDRADIHDAHDSKKWHDNDFHGRLKGLKFS